MKVVYEISFWDFFIPFFLQRTIPILIGFVLIVFLIIKIKKMIVINPESDFVKNIKKQIRHPKTVGYTFAFLFSLLFISLLFFIFSIQTEYLKYINEYMDGNYKTITGEVENFSPYKEPYMGDETATFAPYYGKRESFYVNGVLFDYFPERTFGYETPASHGGFITGNSQYLRICYVTDNNGFNHIMKLEMKNEEE